MIFFENVFSIKSRTVVLGTWDFCHFGPIEGKVTVMVGFMAANSDSKLQCAFSVSSFLADLAGAVAIKESAERALWGRQPFS